MNGDRENVGDMRAGLPAQSLSAVYDAPSSTTWATFLIIATNIIVFLAMAATSGVIWGFDINTLAAWGGNSGLLDLSGQWWRLLTYQFLHINLAHIAINMWVMWSAGRLLEKLFGGYSLLLIYLLSGVLAGLVSITWNPSNVSVGASGAIFGLLGSLVMFLSITRNEIPMWALRYWVPAAIFVLFSLISGAAQPSVDNAAHVGGLLAGLIIGTATMRPEDIQNPLPPMRGIIAVIAVGVLAIPFLWHIDAFRPRSSVFEEFAASHRWYMAGETPNLRLWQILATRAANQTISQDELTQQVKTQILPFWRDADVRFQQDMRQAGSVSNPVVPLVAEFAKLRLGWAQAIIAAQDNSPQHLQIALDYAQKTNFAQAKIDRLKLLIAAENIPRPLYDSAPMRWAASFLPEHRWACIDGPFAKPVSKSDAPADGPSQRHMTGCQAQQMFVRGDYAALDAELTRYSTNLADLPDGSSHYEGIWSGLDALFANGQISLSDALRRAAEWRRAVRGSTQPALIEALIFRNWAYSARGYGYSSSVSAVAMQAYFARSEMAEESLHATKAAERAPEWYMLALGIDRDLSVPVSSLRAIFGEGNAKYRHYFPLYRQMLNSLMPRWGGSIDQVDEFISAVSKMGGSGQSDPALYTRLYLAYGNLEGGDFNVVEAAKADPSLMEIGLVSLRKRYPTSDYVLNSAARFACIDNQVFAYRRLRKIMRNHLSATAWPDNLSVVTCDKWSD